MNNIKEAISRARRSMRVAEYARDNKVSSSWTTNNLARPTAPASSKKRIIQLPDVNLTKNELRKRKKLLQGYQRKVFQDFLSPVNIPNLKIFEAEPRPFDTALATSNWKSKNSQNNVVRYNSYLENRTVFMKMLDLLVELTPAHLLEATDQDLSRNTKTEPKSNARYWFWEIPPMPKPLTPENFKEYIYFLTHTKVLYKNSLSLQSGIIPDILLHTHKTTNTKYKDVRSVDTYNYLIKYFGFDKNQSSFARELLLVMKHDGHTINIDTINSLLKLCLIHANIRTTTNTFQIVIKYLRLSRELGIEIDLRTWTRIYDLIKNIFFKEMFISRLATINLPILPSLGLRILEDFGETTKSTDEVIQFIENDLRLKNWNSHTKFSNKVLHHRAHNVAEGDLESFYSDHCILPPSNDDHTTRYVLQGLQRNKHLTNKTVIVFAFYCRLIKNTEVPEAFRTVLLILLSNHENYKCDQMSFLVRGVIHDAAEMLALPRDVVAYPQGSSPPESYKILRRLTGLRINRFEGILHETHEDAKPISEPLSDGELVQWNELKRQVVHTPLDREKLETVLQLEISDKTTDGAKYQHIQQGKIDDARTRDRVRRLEVGLDTYVLQQMESRRLL